LSKNIGIIGGDLRISKLAELFAKDNYTVHTYALEEMESGGIIKHKSIKDITKNTDYIISGTPLTRDGETILTPLSKETVRIDELFKKLKGKTLIAGSIDETIHKLAKENNVGLIDILEKEELAILNAIPTAEGAIEVAMKESETTLHGNDSLVIGYGRIGKILSKMLTGIGANVYCTARKQWDLAMIEAMGYNKIVMAELENGLEKYDFIFNTAPAMVLDKSRLSKIKKECIIVDLASKPGGVDFEVAEEKGIKAILALRTTRQSRTTYSS